MSRPYTLTPAAAREARMARTIRKLRAMQQCLAGIFAALLVIVAVMLAGMLDQAWTVWDAVP